MTNYLTYPKHRLTNNSCIICFEDGGFSWCSLYNNQRLYLLNSGYLETARKIDVKFYSGKFRSFTKQEFIEWLKKNSKPNEVRKNAK